MFRNKVANIELWKHIAKLGPTCLPVPDIVVSETWHTTKSNKTETKYKKKFHFIPY